jgi:beta-carotene 15,15'-dioxygenase
MFTIIAIFAPEIHFVMAPYLVVASIFLIGIPHGAIDHIISAELFNTGSNFRGHMVFYGSYIFIMLLIGMLWIWVPVAGMILFLAISIYHFGQADMEDFLRSDKKNNTAYVIRGIFIIVLIVYSDTTITLPIITEAINIDLAEAAYITASPFLILFGVSALYLIFSIYLIFFNKITHPLVFISDFFLIMLLFTICGPLTGFAVYFAVWHSAGHIYQMQQFYLRNSKVLSVATFYRLALPFTLVSISGLFILFFINNVSWMTERILTLMFILISVLTLPHMIIVDRLYSHNE